jgi:hypothetical protein
MPDQDMVCNGRKSVQIILLFFRQTFSPNTICFRHLDKNIAIGKIGDRQRKPCSTVVYLPQIALSYILDGSLIS